MTKAKFLRIPDGKLEGIYQMKVWKGQVDLERLPGCACCHAELTPAFDVCQWGLFDDKYTTFFVCKPCQMAWKIEYCIPSYALVSKREQTKLGLIPSKKSREAGSDRRER